jgi:acetyltransferase-like isoleucine patch superfamily enzyme
MCPSNGELLELPDDAVVEPGVVLGRRPERDIEITPLVIGRGALIRSGSVLYLCTTIGDGLQTGHNAIIREQNDIGDGFQLWSGSIVDYGCVIGSNVKIHSGCYIAQFTEIGDGVFIGPGVVATNDRHPGCPKFRECMKGPSIGAGAVIGGGTTLLPAVKIGERALVGAGSVVTRDVEPHAVVYGNPAVGHGTIEELECCTGMIDRPYEP